MRVIYIEIPIDGPPIAYPAQIEQVTPRGWRWSWVNLPPIHHAASVLDGGQLRVLLSTPWIAWRLTIWFLA
jgi:hypothetical protein